MLRKKERFMIDGNVVEPAREALMRTIMDKIGEAHYGRVPSDARLYDHLHSVTGKQLFENMVNSGAIHPVFRTSDAYHQGSVPEAVFSNCYASGEGVMGTNPLEVLDTAALKRLAAMDYKQDGNILMEAASLLAAPQNGASVWEKSQQILRNAIADPANHTLTEGLPEGVSNSLFYLSQHGVESKYLTTYDYKATPALAEMFAGPLEALRTGQAIVTEAAPAVLAVKAAMKPVPKAGADLETEIPDIEERLARASEHVPAPVIPMQPRAAAPAVEIMAAGAGSNESALETLITDVFESGARRDVLEKAADTAHQKAMLAYAQHNGHRVRHYDDIPKSLQRQLQEDFSRFSRDPQSIPAEVKEVVQDNLTKAGEFLVEKQALDQKLEKVAKRFGTNSAQVLERNGKPALQFWKTREVTQTVNYRPQTSSVSSQVTIPRSTFFNHEGHFHTEGLQQYKDLNKVLSDSPIWTELESSAVRLAAAANTLTSAVHSVGADGGIILDFFEAPVAKSAAKATRFETLVEELFSSSAAEGEACTISMQAARKAEMAYAQWKYPEVAFEKLAGNVRGDIEAEVINLLVDYEKTPAGLSAEAREALGKWRRLSEAHDQVFTRIIAAKEALEKCLGAEGVYMSSWDTERKLCFDFAHGGARQTFAIPESKLNPAGMQEFINHELLAHSPIWKELGIEGTGIAAVAAKAAGSLSSGEMRVFQPLDSDVELVTRAASSGEMLAFSDPELRVLSLDSDVELITHPVSSGEIPLQAWDSNPEIVIDGASSGEMLSFSDPEIVIHDATSAATHAVSGTGAKNVETLVADMRDAAGNFTRLDNTCRTAEKSLTQSILGKKTGVRFSELKSRELDRITRIMEHYETFPDAIPKHVLQHYLKSYAENIGPREQAASSLAECSAAVAGHFGVDKASILVREGTTSVVLEKAMSRKVLGMRVPFTGRTESVTIPVADIMIGGLPKYEQQLKRIGAILPAVETAAGAAAAEEVVTSAASSVIPTVTAAVPEPVVPPEVKPTVRSGAKAAEETEGMWAMLSRNKSLAFGAGAVVVLGALVGGYWVMTTKQQDKNRQQASAQLF